MSVVLSSVQTYKENVLEPMLNGTEKAPPLITDYKDYHTDTTVRFVVKMTEEKLSEAEAAGLHKVFKLQNALTCNSMVDRPRPQTSNQPQSSSPSLLLGPVRPRGQSEEVRVGAGHSPRLLRAEDEVLRAEEGLVVRHVGGRERKAHQPGPLHPGEDPGHAGHWWVPEEHTLTFDPWHL